MPKFKYDPHKGRMVMERDDDRTPEAHRPQADTARAHAGTGLRDRQ